MIQIETAMDPLNEKLEQLTARAEITDVIGRYTYGMDSRDWALYRSCWTEEIRVDFSDLPGYGGMTPATLPADTWVAAMRALFEEMPHSQHLKLPICFDIRGDEATVLSLMQRATRSCSTATSSARPRCSAAHWIRRHETGPFRVVRRWIHAAGGGSPNTERSGGSPSVNASTPIPLASSSTSISSAAVAP